VAMDLWTRLNENPGDELVDLFDVSADDLGESAVRKLMGLQDRVLTTTAIGIKTRRFPEACAQR